MGFWVSHVSAANVGRCQKADRRRSSFEALPICRGSQGSGADTVGHRSKAQAKALDSPLRLQHSLQAQASCHIERQACRKGLHRSI